MPADDFTIDHVLIGKAGKVALTIRCGDTAAKVFKTDILDEGAREKAKAQILKAFPGLDTSERETAVVAALLRIAELKFVLSPFHKSRSSLVVTALADTYRFSSNAAKSRCLPSKWPWRLSRQPLGVIRLGVGPANPQRAHTARNHQASIGARVLGRLSRMANRR